MLNPQFARPRECIAPVALFSKVSITATFSTIWFGFLPASRYSIRSGTSDWDYV